MRVGLLVVLAGLLAAPIMGAPAVEHFQSVFAEDFEGYEVGPLRAGVGGWELMQQTKTSASVALAEGRGKALRILDDHQALEDATCRLRRPLGSLPGRALVRARIMLCRGEAEAVAQDMGLQFYGGGRLLFDLFFSGGELKTWQGPTWAGLEPPVCWEEGHWYDIELRIDAPAGKAEVAIDGRSHAPVSLRAAAPGIDLLQIISQRFARGELWVDDIRVAYEPPAELRAKPSAAWEKATPKERHARWFPDEGGATVRDGLALADGKLASMRRWVAADMDSWPLLCLEVSGAGDAPWSLHVRPADGGAAEALELRSPVRGRREYDLFAAGAWEGKRTFELLLSARGKGRLSAGPPAIEECPAPETLADPATVWRHVSPSERRNALSGPLRLRVDGAPGDALPVTHGVPFPRGVLHNPATLALHDAAGKPLPLQTQALSAWDDGSVRWLLLDTQTEVPASGQAEVVLSDSGKARVERPLAVEEGAAIRIDAGPLTLRIPRERFGPISGLRGGFDGRWDLVARFDGRTFRAGLGDYRAAIETNGPVRAVVTLSGTLSDGRDAPFRYELRLAAFRGLSRMELAPTFTLVTSQPEVQLQEVTLVLGGRFPAGQVTAGIDGKPATVARAAGEGVSLLQDARDRCALLVGKAKRAGGTHADGWLDTGELTLAVRRCWQQFAKCLRVSDEEVRVELWTPEAAPRRFGQGAAKTHHLLLAFHAAGEAIEGAARRARAFEHPPVLHPGARWYFDSLGMGHFPVPSEKHAEMDRVYTAALEKRLREQQRLAATSYDMVHFGDVNHINSEIDAHKAFFMQWARTGERRWLDFALDGALHSQDLDVCHYSANPREIGIHHSHYPSDHNNGGLTLTHTWIEGQLFRFYLTGDRRSLIAADLSGRAFGRSLLPTGQIFDGGSKGGGVGSRAYGRACWALCELFRATRNPRYLWAMKRLNGYLVASLREDGAIPVSHDGAGEWSRTDECPHMAAICSVGLARYADLTGDRSDVAALERVARWQMSRGAMPEKLGIMYHNYPGGEVIHFVDACADMLEAWAFLYDATGNPLYRDFAESVYDNMIEMSDRWAGDWTMGLRSVLFYLGRRDRWKEPQPAARAPAMVAVTAWLQGCQTPDGGFAMAPGLPSDMDSTYRALDALKVLGTAPRDREACMRWILSCRNADGGCAGEPGWHSNVAWTWMALAGLKTLGVPPPRPEETVAWLRSVTNDNGGGGSSPVTGPIPYHPAWPSSAEYTAYNVQALALLGAGPADREKTTRYLQGLQTAGAGFRHSGAGPVSGYTLDALDGLAALGAAPSDAKAVGDWLTGLRRADGGYGWPDSDRSTLRSTAHCVLALARLDRLPGGEDAAATARYIRSCQAESGGFGHRPGRTPTVTATWYAVRALQALGALTGPADQDR